MAVHELKTWPDYFDQTWNDNKRWELRYNDRKFEKGDLVLLREYNVQERYYTGREIRAHIGYILDAPGFGLKPGYIVFSLKGIEKKFNAKGLNRG